MTKDKQGKPLIELITDEVGDWQKLLIDGKVRSENHSLSGRDVLDSLCRAGIIRTKFRVENSEED